MGEKNFVCTFQVNHKEVFRETSRSFYRNVLNKICKRPYRFLNLSQGPVHQASSTHTPSLGGVYSKSRRSTIFGVKADDSCIVGSRLIGMNSVILSIFVALHFG